MTSHDHRLYLEMREQDAMAFVAIGGKALHDADLISVELHQLHYADIHDTVERSRLYAARDAAVARISQAIEEAE